MLFTIPLKKNEDFKSIYRLKKSKADNFFVLFKKENGLSKNRLGVSVSKKVGNSVVRHRIKRLVKEIYRNIEKDILPGFDIVFMARKDAKGKDFSIVRKSIIRLLKLQKLYKS